MCKCCALLAVMAAMLGACGDDVWPVRPDASAAGGSGGGVVDAGLGGDGGVSLGGRGGPTVLRVRVLDAQSGKPVAAKLFVFHGDQPMSFANYRDPPFCIGTGESMFEVGTGALVTQNGIIVYRGEALVPWPTARNPWLVKPNRCEPNREPIVFGPAKLRLVATRGLEFEFAEAELELRDGMGPVDLTFQLSRAVDTSGYLSADLHIHSALWRERDVLGGSSDSGVSPVNRVKTELGAGVEILVSSDHDWVTDFGPALREIFPNPSTPLPAATVVGNEVSPGYGHFNTIPVAFDSTKPRNGAFDPKLFGTLAPRALLESLHASPTGPIVQLNHPRLGFAAYFDTDGLCGGVGGWLDRQRLPTCSVDFDAIEVMSGQQGCTTEIRQQLEDWYALARFGVLSAGIGSSDTHFDAGVLAGYPRSFVRMGIDDPARFDEGEFVAALRRRSVVASTGPFVTLLVNDRFHEGDLVPMAGTSVKVSFRVQHPSWMKPDVARLLVDGVPTKTWTIAPQASPGLFTVEGEMLTLAKDAFINVEVEGSQMLPDWLVGNYLSLNKHEDGRWFCPNDDDTGGMRPFAVTNFVLVDVDRDGQWRGSRQPAAMPDLDDRWVPPADLADDCDPRLHGAAKRGAIYRKPARD